MDSTCDADSLAPGRQGAGVKGVHGFMRLGQNARAPSQGDDGGLVIAPPSPGYRAKVPLRFDALPPAPEWVTAPPEGRGTPR